MAGQSRTAMMQAQRLTPQEAIFVTLVVQLGDEDAAYKAAGYKTDVADWTHFAARLARRPDILAALHVEVGRALRVDATAARRLARKLMDDDTTPAKIRADLAIKLLRLGGHIEPKAPDAISPHDKPLAEMTSSELRERVSALEREIADRSKPIISASVVPPADDVIDIVEELGPS